MAEQIEIAGGQVAFQEIDVTARVDVARLVDSAVDRFGRLDVYINNAGIAPNSLLDDLKVEDWEATIDVNLKGPLYGIAAALPVFRRQRSGRQGFDRTGDGGDGDHAGRHRARDRLRD